MARGAPARLRRLSNELAPLPSSRLRLAAFVGRGRALRSAARVTNPPVETLKHPGWCATRHTLVRHGGASSGVALLGQANAQNAQPMAGPEAEFDGRVRL